MSNYLAIDLGAESGRAILGVLEDGRLRLEELHRFLNQPVRLPDGLYWDSFRLFFDILEGLRKAGRERGLKLDGVAVDTWGVDFGLFSNRGDLLGAPRHYRDDRNQPAYDAALSAVGADYIFSQSGLQFMALNSLYQLYAMKLAGAQSLWNADKLLFMPDLLSFWLSGVMKNELTIASTSQFYHPERKAWSTELLQKLNLPTHILGEVVLPGTRLGSLRDEVRDTTGLGETPVFATAGHDTAAAVAAVPATGEESWCYISSGTWSLMGVESDTPVMTAQAQKLTLTNEIGVEGKIRLLKNIAGLWLVQECRRAWLLDGHDYDYPTLTRLAAEAAPFQAVLDPDQFLAPGHMPERIAEYCRRTGQTPPEGPGGYVRVCLESLAFRYRQVLESLEEVTNQRISVIHIVGGGAKNTLLNQFVAAATGRKVVAGPTEATAIGNVLVQALGAGEIADLKALRQVVRDSFELETYSAEPSPAWDAAYQRYLQIRG